MSADISDIDVITAIDNKYEDIINWQLDIVARVIGNKAVTEDEVNTIEISTMSEFEDLLVDSEKYTQRYKWLKSSFKDISNSIIDYIGTHMTYNDCQVSYNGCLIIFKRKGGYQAQSDKLRSVIDSYSENHNLSLSLTIDGIEAWIKVEPKRW